MCRFRTVPATLLLAAVVILALHAVAVGGVTAAGLHSGGAQDRVVDSPSSASGTGAGSTQWDVIDPHAPPDPESDTLGWENGVWHNETIHVDTTDGLNDTELEAVVARSMARVEFVRELEFEETPPVEVITREEHEEILQGVVENITQNERLRHNIQYEAVFLVNESTDSVSVEQQNRAGGVKGFYDPEDEEIKIVSNSVTTPKMDEITLAQELFHALQDQKYNISRFNRSTIERSNAALGVIEGDGNFVDHLYEQECTDGIWANTCLMPEDSGAPEDFSPHLGLYQLNLQAYSSGPAFVQQRYNDGGWEAVNELYENPPRSSEQVIHPDKYRSDEPINVTVPAESEDPWQRLRVNDSETAGETPSFAQFGEAGLYIALWYPGFQTRGTSQIVPLRSHLNRDSPGEDLPDIEPYLYESDPSAGWEGDKLVPYVTDDSAETNETGYVYKLVWESPEEAAEFREAWLELLRFHGAEAVPGRLDTWQIPDDAEFGDAFYLEQDGDTVRIVNGPTVEDLSLIAEGAAPEGEATPSPGDGGDGAGVGQDGSGSDGSTGGADGTETTGDGGAGFTPLVAVLGVAIALVLGRLHVA